ncbi:iron uptake system protein EfeO [Mesorhizobium sp. CU2]|uniref:iron uptake system protein EfeO n=1 Tax=unclassified Mesorhizobium TaxID=325217 RepID=UPI00112EC63C|nr:MULTISPECIES: iron uptake system protein EfeO [unclassified Mesorhizobium]TPN75460.1 iron uptake system protein EfeO [Mesorhizobium sp. CU3]TPO21214.1 iron uptake system protein EfeO [Mesorhizobium sp. CU2]
MSASTQPQALPRGAVRAGLAASLALVVAAAAAFTYATLTVQKSRRDQAASTVVAITGQACEPNELTVSAGQNSFRITNRSDRAVEWEILDGVMVLEERENIAPGFTQELSARLEPGDYAITCGLLSNPRGRLHVLPVANATPVARPNLTAFIGALAEYKVFLASEADAFADAAGAFAGAVKSGDLAAAKAAYLPAETAYAHMAAISPLFSDLDAAIDARADAFGRREADPAFGGLHRLEYGLFSQRNLDGLAPVADRLVRDATQLKARIHDLRIMPESMAGGAAAIVERVAAAGPAFGDSPYAHADLSSFAATIAGARKVYDLLRPVAAKPEPDIVAALDKDLAGLDAMIAARRGEGAERLDDAAKADLGKRATTLAADISRLRETMDLSQ